MNIRPPSDKAVFRHASPGSPATSPASPGPGGPVPAPGALDGVAAREPQVGSPDSTSRKRKREDDDGASPCLPAASGHEKRRLLDRGVNAPPATPAAPAWDPVDEAGASEGHGVGAGSSPIPLLAGLGDEWGSPTFQAPRLMRSLSLGQAALEAPGHEPESPPVDVATPDDGAVEPDEMNLAQAPASPSSLAPLMEQADAPDEDEVQAAEGAEDGGDEQVPLPVHGRLVQVTVGAGYSVTARYADIDQNINGADPQSKLVIARAGDGTAGVFTDCISGGPVVVFTAPGQVGVLHTTARDDALHAEAQEARAQFIEATGAEQVDTHVVFAQLHLDEAFEWAGSNLPAQAIADDHELDIPDEYQDDDAAAKAWIKQALLTAHEGELRAFGTALHARSVAPAPWAAVLVQAGDGALNLFDGAAEAPIATPLAEPADEAH